MMDVRQITLFPSGVIRIPPSKSISHRAIICAGLAEGESVLENVSLSQDIEATIRCMRAFGASHEWDEWTLRVKGGTHRAGELLDCGESGSTLRFLIPLAALFRDTISFTGRGRLMERPLGPYLDALAAHGVLYTHTGNTLSISGPMMPGVFRIPGDISSQFVSGLLLALPLLHADSEILITTPLQSAGYVDLTMDVMQKFGVSVEHEDYRRFFVRGNQRYRPKMFRIEADYSQAAFFLVAGALGSACECEGLAPDSKQGDRAVVEILRRCGANVERTNDGNVAVRPGKLRAQNVDVSGTPDLVPPLAALLCFCEGTSRIVNAARLRHKESDRLQTVAHTLNALGGNVSIEGDGLTIVGVPALHGGLVQSFDDHRIPMMAAVAAIRSTGPVSIEGSGSVAKSYPDFWKDFEKTPKGEF